MRVVMTFLLAFLTSVGTWATGGTPAGSGTSSDPYVIADAADWTTFTNWINNSNGTYGSKCYKLGADITISSMAGTSSYKFKGTFDGDGHTMTLDNLSSSGEFCAPFRYVDGATIKRLHTTGKVVAGTDTSNDKFRTGLVGESKGTTTISNCWSSVTITSEIDGDGTHGGFVGVINGGTLTLNNCLFDGTISGDKTHSNGGFVGWNNNTLNINNCLMAGTMDVLATNGATFSRNKISSISNSYYVTAHGTVQGTAVGTMTNSELQEALGNGWEISSDKVVPVMDIKNLTAGSIICNTFFPYTGSEITVTPTVKDMDDNTIDVANYSVVISPSTVQASGNYTMTVTGNANGYSGTLTHSFRVALQLSGAGTEAEPYTIATTADWNRFAQIVNEGYNYEGEFVKLTANIDNVTTMVGLREDGGDQLLDAPFKGTFDGGYHTLTAAIVSTATGTGVNEQGVAPFHYIKHATIKNLTVAGSITSDSQYAGGLVGWAGSGSSSEKNTITDCVVTATLTIGADYAGGLVGHVQPSGNGYMNYNYFTNCVFAGTIQSSTTDQRMAGAMFGYGSAYTYFTNCLENGTYANLRLMSPRGSYGSYQINSVTSLYYVNKIGSDQYITERNGCNQVLTAAPADIIYLTRTIKDYTVYQPAILSDLRDVFAYNNGEPVSISYALKMGNTAMTKDTDYEVTIKNKSNVTVAPEDLKEVGTYTIHFTAKAGNKAGYTGEIVRSFEIVVGESLEGYAFATEGEGDNKKYLIRNEGDLERLAAYINSNHNALGLTFKLTDNITMTAPHTAIGGLYDNSYRSFRGTFDGSQNKISNLTINKPNENHQGLFGRLGESAVVKDLTVNGYDITGKQYVGAIAGSVCASSSNRATIQNCHVNGTNVGSVANADSHGGIVGYGYYVDITGCTSQGTISTTAGNVSYGGIIGFASSNVKVISCENTASITGEGDNHAGIVGDDDSSSNSYSLCLNTGTVEGGSYKGGIAGQYFTAHFTNCYYAAPCTVKALGNNDYSGHGERGYLVAAGSHIASLSAAEAGVVESILTGKKYYKQGNWTLTLTPTLNEETFLTYACEGGTLTNLTTVEGDHTLTITDQDVTISAIVSSNSGIDIVNATIADIPEQRWKGGEPVTPTLNVTYNETKLVLGTDYIVEASNNTSKVENATVTITGINNYKGKKSANFSIVDFKGTGTQDDPWQIATEEDLEALAGIVNTGVRTNGYYKQKENITLTKEHTAIGNGSNKFQGNYDGDYKTISGLVINKPNSDNEGLFGYTYNATVQHVVVDCDITARQYVGGIVGQAQGTNITYCTVSGAIKTAADVQGYDVGGIAGYSSGSLTYCVNTASITAYGTNSKCYGGITGYNNNGISNNFNAGVVTGATYYVGSIVGQKGGSLTNNYHTVTTVGGVGDNYVSTSADQPGAEVVVKITATDGVTLTLPDEPAYVWNAEDLYKSGTVVTLDYALPDGKFFDHYTVNSGAISNASSIKGTHTLTGFTEDVVITGSYANEITNLATAGAVIADIDNLIYNGSEQHPAPVVTLGDETLEAGGNYTVSYSDGCTNAGEYTVTVTGTGRFDGSIYKTFNINPLNVSGCNITIDNMAYTGNVIEVTPTVKRGSVTLEMGEDKDYTFVTNPATVQAAGDYTLTITGKGNYTGTKDATFNVYAVVPSSFTCSEVTASSATLTWTDARAANWTVELSESSDFSTLVESKEVTERTATFTGLTADVNYYARVKAVYGEVSSNWSSTLLVQPSTKLMVGSGNNTKYSYPFYLWYHYNLTQQIYTPSELGNKAGSILSLDFCRTDNNACKNSIDIYLVQTTKNSFESETDWIKVTAADKVFSGSVDFVSNGWTTITLDTPFDYDGTSNLAVIVYDPMVSGDDYGSSRSFRVFKCAANQAIQYNSDSTDPTVEPTVSGSRDEFKNQLRIRFATEKIELADNATDNSTTIAANDRRDADVTLKDRTLYKDGEWNTICLPFNVTLAGSPLEGATAKTLTDASVTGTTVHLTFGDAVSELVAGTPYIIKWDAAAENIVEPVFRGVTIDKTERNIAFDGDCVKFIGYYDAFPITPANSDIFYMTVGNKLKYTGVARTLNACRAYFQFDEHVVAAREFVLDFGDSQTTGIMSVDADSKVDNIYDLGGRKMNNNSHLKKGLYIQNGKKTVIK